MGVPEMTEANLATAFNPTKRQGPLSPEDIVRDRNMSTEDKRALLASWASDVCAVEAAPALRRVPGTGKAVAFDDVMEALRSLDRIAGGGRRSHYRRVLENRRPGVFGRKSAPDSGPTLN